MRSEWALNRPERDEVLQPEPVARIERFGAGVRGLRPLVFLNARTDRAQPIFAHAATCGRFDDSPTQKEIFDAILLPGGGFEFKDGTVFELLDKAGVKYRIYADDQFPNVAELDGVSIVGDIREFKDFKKDLKDSSFDAGDAFIEPSYDALDSFEDGNSQHPKGSTAAGERFIKATYEAIRSSPVWRRAS